MKNIASISLVTDNLRNNHQILVDFADGFSERYVYQNLQDAIAHRDTLQQVMCNQVVNSQTEDEQMGIVVRTNLLEALREIDELYNTEDIYIKKLRKALIKVIAHYSAYGDATNHPEVNAYLTKTLKY